MRIAIFTEVFLPKIDGVVTRLLGTLDQLRDMGHEAVVFAPGHPPARYAGFRVEPVRSIAFKPWYPELKLGLPTARIATTMERFNPHVVHAVNPVWLAAWGTMAATRRNLPLLASFHTDVPEYATRLGLEWITDTSTRWVRYMHNRAEVNLCTSGPMVKRAQEAGIRNVGLWPRAVDTQTYSPENYSHSMRERLTDGHPNDPLVLYVGRLSKEKDLDVCRGMLEHLPANTRLAMVGSGPHRAQLESMFAGTNTVFTGYLSGQDLAAAYASADAFIFPSMTETLGLVALESLASGVPVVGARAGGIPYAVADERTGFLFEPGSSAEAAHKIALLLENRSLREKMARAGREQAQEWGWRSATEALVGFYESAIDLHRYAPKSLAGRLRS